MYTRIEPKSDNLSLIEISVKKKVFWVHFIIFLGCFVKSEKYFFMVNSERKFQFYFLNAFEFDEKCGRILHIGERCGPTHVVEISKALTHGS